MTIIISLIIASILLAIVSAPILHNEKEIIKKAENNAFYHLLAKLIIGVYPGYKLTQDEQKALDDFKKAKSTATRTPIGAFYKLSDENEEICKLNGNFSGETYKSPCVGDMAIGIAVMVAFFVTVAFGYYFN